MSEIERIKAWITANQVAALIIAILGLVALYFIIGAIIPDKADDDLGMSLFKDKAGKYSLQNTTKLAIAEGVKPQAPANATMPTNSTTPANSTYTPSEDNPKLGGNNNVDVVAGFPTTLGELTSFINSCPSVEDEEFNDAWDGSSIESSAMEIKILPEGSTDAIASLVEQYGTTKVWKAIQGADVSTAFLWKSDGYGDQIRTAEQAADKPYSLDFEYYKVDSDGSKDDVNGQMDEDGTLYAADYNFK